MQLQALLQAPRFWADVARCGGQDPGYARTGRVQPLKDARAVELARERAAGADALWRGEAFWRVREGGGALDPLSPTGLVAQDSLSGRIHPRQAVAALAAAVTALGGKILREGVLSGHVIHATGAAGLRDLSASLGRAIGRGEKGQALVLDFAARGAAQIYAPGLHIVPHSNGTTAIGSTSERDYDDPVATDAQLDDLHARALEVLPVLAGAKVLQRWAGERPRAATRTLILAPHPDRAGHYIANGGFKTGFALAPLACAMLIDLITTGENRIPESWALPQ